MKMQDKEVKSMLGQLKAATFTNEHGEEFIIKYDGMTAYMAGDEVDQMVDPKYKAFDHIMLFNPAFSLWSAEELFKLGKALQEVSGYEQH